MRGKLVLFSGLLGLLRLLNIAAPDSRGKRPEKTIYVHAAVDATGSRKKDKRLKEKTVVTVVRVGKVGNLPMWLFRDGFGGAEFSK